ncbi:oxidoreductase [Paenibacillus mesophilus]|uniref:flavin-containing monooxygenase n=1 Tax=Paenibacillus mesophilus TaxID=2582849 RepID=UPI00110E9CBE|nr:NAD(P)/FAD-dependent oxidoreductase [Paenibacillus mesophilus]TMV46319.1 oxidoreductase [Paenibacillus mesophilus]
MIEKDVIVIGGGQAGLSMGYYLQKNGSHFVILDANGRTGDSWRNRYDSLFLFTPRMYNSLPGLAFAGRRNGLPAKDEAADYLERYARHFSLPILFNTTITLLKKTQKGFYLRSEQGEEFTAKEVVIAAGPFQKPFIPSFSNGLNPDLYQVHSSHYRNPAELNAGPVMVVGAGNSGAQIAVELAKQHEVTISVGHRMDFKPLYFLGKSIFWYFNKMGLLDADLNTKRASWLKKKPEQIYGLELKNLLNAKTVKMKPRAVSAAGDTIRFEDSTSARAANVIWATGFRSDYSWVHIPGALHTNGIPQHERGVSPIAGLYFLGLPWQSRRGSALMGWVGQDAEYLMRKMTT